MESLQKTIDKLSPLERKIAPFLNLPVKEIKEKSGLDNTSLLRALKFLESKGLIKTNTEKKRIIALGTNGIYYKKNHLPERSLLILIENRKVIPLEEAKKISKLSENEFKVSLGILKSKAMIELKNGKIFLTASKEEITKKTLEEQLIESLPLEESKLQPEQQFALQNLKKRKDIVEIEEKTTTAINLTDSGKQIAGKRIESHLIEEVTPEVIKNWKRGNKFRRYDLNSNAPVLYGGKKHFVNKAIEKGKRIWLDMGFKEMSSTITQTSFWNFDALFTAQDHPVRELQDTFFLKDLKGNLPEKKLVDEVKKTHEQGVDKSKGWQYSWDEEESKRVVLRTHTTCLSAKTLASLDVKKDLPAKFFSIGKCFRNETVDWSHGFEFYQTEGIVVDKNLSLRNLLGYLKEFYKKMGFEKVRFAPGYFPYTEPSVEINVFHPEKKVWIELGGAGIFRPEITIPLLGTKVPVLAWGQGFDRIITDHYQIKDLREMYSNDLSDLRKKQVWMK
ncbi:MAG: phenylalanine--tRNA ligase subunit alpha [Nanoarchaeota archaeon]|nr:phenylalanine--tRNA ligase subunit alpha [Nanoarchaeota archaeon]MBU0977495.1 phenylalanine--tRNA ligase subunit alpha [Nanoarchaeota archaeon]